MPYGSLQFFIFIVFYLWLFLPSLVFIVNKLFEYYLRMFSFLHNLVHIIPMSSGIKFSVDKSEIILNFCPYLWLFFIPCLEVFHYFFFKLSHFVMKYSTHWGFWNGAVVKSLPANSGDEGNGDWISVLGRPLGGGNGNPLGYSYLKNPMNRGAWWATVHGFLKSQT